MAISKFSEAKISGLSRYRPEIDGLRAFAVVAVIINHFNKDILPGGYLGVDIFFVISGYVISSSLVNRPTRDFKDFISGFYERRLKRLVPALSVFVLITSVAICLFSSNPRAILNTGFSSLFGLSNLYLLRQSTDYFAQSTELNPFTHTWSLGVEEQFYIIFPLLIWFSGFGRQIKNGARNLFLVVGILTIASLVGFLYLYSVNQPAAYFLMPARFWEMASGCLIFIGFQKKISIEKFLEMIPPFLIIALIILIMYLPISYAAASTIAVVVLSSILIASLKSNTAAFKVFTNSKIVYIGLISYSLYLWHWGVLSLSRWTIGIHWWSVPIQVVLMLGLAIISYQFIETPLRRGSWFGKRWKTLVLAGGLLVVSSSIIISIRKLSSTFYLKSSFPISQQPWWLDKEGNYIEKCHVKANFTIQLMNECLGNSQNEVDIATGYLIGDSHARNYLIAVEKAFPSINVKYLTMGGGCAFMPSIMISKEVDNGTACKSYIKNVASLIAKKSKPGDVVFIGQALRGDDHDLRAIPEYFEHIQAFAETLNEKSVPVVIFDGTFPPGLNPELCLREKWRPFPNKSDCEKTVEEADFAFKKFDEMALATSNLSSNIYYVPLRLGLCLDKTCGQYTKYGTPIWHDFGHITEKSSGELAHLIRKQLPQEILGVDQK